MSHIRKYLLPFGALILLVTYVGTFASASATTEKLVLGCNSFPPLKMQSSEGKASGRDVDILNAAARHSDLDISYVFYPWKRAYKKAENFEIDGLCSCSYHEDRAASFHFTDPIGETVIGIFSINRKRRFAPLFSDLSSHKVGVVLGYNLEQELKENNINYQSTQTEEQLIRLLEKDRIEFAYSYKSPLLHYAKNLNLIRPLDFYATRRSPYNTCLRKGIENDKLILERLNAGIQKIKETGEYQAIQEKY